MPFYKSVYDLSGYPDIVKQKGLDFSYQLAPRAKIFRRDADKVIKMDDMKHIMRDNGELFYVIHKEDCPLNSRHIILIIHCRHLSMIEKQGIKHYYFMPISHRKISSGIYNFH